MSSQARLSFEASKEKLLRTLDAARDVTFIRGYGNIGDLLINAGVRQLLSDVDYDEVSAFDVRKTRGHTAVFPGAGGFCEAHHRIPEHLAEIDRRFEQVIVLPSSFDTSVFSVRNYLERTSAHVFARERESFEQIRSLCRADLAHDCAFYFDFEPYRRKGRGTLIAYRTDRESALTALPEGNNDISYTCETLDEFLWTIARHELIRTDRAHVMIAAAMLGKTVEYCPSNYHKIPAIAEFSLADYPVRLTAPPSQTKSTPGSNPTVRRHDQSVVEEPFPDPPSSPPNYDYWPQWIELSAMDIKQIVPPLNTFILVDGAQLGELPVYNRLVLPFLERNGQYWGHPSDSREAIDELERLRRGGAQFIVFAWTAFWWSESYPELIHYLRSRFILRLQNERLMIFELRPRNVEGLRGV